MCPHLSGHVFLLIATCFLPEWRGSIADRVSPETMMQSGCSVRGAVFRYETRCLLLYLFFLSVGLLLTYISFVRVDLSGFFVLVRFLNL